MRKEQKKIKEKVEKVLATCLENGMSEHEAIGTVRRILTHSYSVKLVSRSGYRRDGDTEGICNPTAFYKRMKKAQIEGTPRLNGELMK